MRGYVWKVDNFEYVEFEILTGVWVKWNCCVRVQE